MKCTVSRAEFGENRRILAVSDVHAHPKYLEKLLEKVNFCTDDILVIAGDLTEKGPDTLGALRLVMRLCKEYTIYPLMGNVDMWRLANLNCTDAESEKDVLRGSLLAKKWWGSAMLCECAQEMGVTPDENMDIHAFLRDVREKYKEELSFIASLPTALETERFIFVHGGLPHENTAAFADTDVYELLKNDDFLSQGKSFQKYVFVGHWPVTLYHPDAPDANPIYLRDRHIVSMDGGCGVKEDGQLNMIVIPNGLSDAFSFLSYDDFPLIRALDDQKMSENSVNIRWIDHEVEYLRTEGALARVRHHGRETLVPASFVHQKDGKYICNDVTDKRLHINKGDELALLWQYDGACYVKKDGQSGWYDGRYETTSERTNPTEIKLL